MYTVLIDDINCSNICHMKYGKLLIWPGLGYDCLYLLLFVDFKHCLLTDNRQTIKIIYILQFSKFRVLSFVFWSFEVSDERQRFWIWVCPVHVLTTFNWIKKRIECDKKFLKMLPRYQSHQLKLHFCLLLLDSVIGTWNTHTCTGEDIVFDIVKHLENIIIFFLFWKKKKGFWDKHRIILDSWVVYLVAW